MKILFLLYVWGDKISTFFVRELCNMNERGDWKGYKCCFIWKQDKTKLVRN